MRTARPRSQGRSAVRHRLGLESSWRLAEATLPGIPGAQGLCLIVSVVSECQILGDSGLRV